MDYEREARETLTPIEMDSGDTLRFELHNGDRRRIELLDTSANIMFTTLDTDSFPLERRTGARTFYEFSCEIRLDGRVHRLRREVPTRNSFYEPWVIDGLRIWFDAVDDIFSFLTESHGECRPQKEARFAVQDASKRICPEPVHPWCPLPAGGMDIYSCYLGENCWLGSYYGAHAHGGLDINHPSGTPIWAPVDFDDQYYFDTLESGANNNRHRGHHQWSDGSEWQLQCHHMTHLTVEERSAVEAGEPYASGAGVCSGYHDHSHFVFRIEEPDGSELVLDPWILFWQMYQDMSEGLVPDQRIKLER